MEVGDRVYKVMLIDVWFGFDDDVDHGGVILDRFRSTIFVRISLMDSSLFIEV